jgi:hypothetical protein
LLLPLSKLGLGLNGQFTGMFTVANQAIAYLLPCLPVDKSTTALMEQQYDGSKSDDCIAGLLQCIQSIWRS